MPPFNPHINLTALAHVCNIQVPDASKPRCLLIFRNMQLKKNGLLTIPVLKCLEEGSEPQVGSYVWLNGPFRMLSGTDGSIEANIFHVVNNKPLVSLVLPPPFVTAAGTVACVMGCNVYMDVAAYNSEVKAMITYQIVVHVPGDGCQAKMKMPSHGDNVRVWGALSSMAVHEDHDEPSAKATNVTFMPRAVLDNKSKQTGGRTKRQHVAEKCLLSVSMGRPMKKTKSGPITAFSHEELSGGSSLQSNSQSSKLCSSPGMGSTTSSQESALSSPTPFRGERLFLKAINRLEQSEKA
ncbi:hypothetical protein RHS03_08070, partial [Rhizoctonia solani]